MPARRGRHCGRAGDDSTDAACLVRIRRRRAGVHGGRTGPRHGQGARPGRLSIDDVGLIEINEAFAVQVLAFLDHYGIADDDPRVNPFGGAIALGHPLASSGVRLMNQLARLRGPPRGPVRHHHDVRRDRDGRHCRLGEPAARALRQQGGRLTTIETVDFPAEVVTKALVRFVELPLRRRKAALITLDNGHDHKPNTLGRPALENSIGRSPRHTPSLAWSPSASHGKPFILAAGADLKGMALVTDRKLAVDAARLGHRVFGRLGDGPIPTFAFINGLALGGGLEVALHCAYRTVHGCARDRLPGDLPRPGSGVGRSVAAAQPGRR